MAAEQGHAEMVRRLLAEGADLAAPAASGDTPLHAALRGGHAAVAAALLQAGASLGVKGADGRTAHELAPPGALEVAEAEQAHEVAVAPALRLSEAERLLEDGRPGEAADAYLGAASLCAGGGDSLGAGARGGSGGRATRAAGCWAGSCTPPSIPSLSNPHRARPGQAAAALPAARSRVLPAPRRRVKVCRCVHRPAARRPG